ncbi:hypothetical protein R6Z07F_004890 [Ovis aries]
MLPPGVPSDSQNLAPPPPIHVEGQVCAGPAIPPVAVKNAGGKAERKECCSLGTAGCNPIVSHEINQKQLFSINQISVLVEVCGRSTSVWKNSLLSGARPAAPQSREQWCELQARALRRRKRGEPPELHQAPSKGSPTRSTPPTPHPASSQLCIFAAGGGSEMGL